MTQRQKKKPDRSAAAGQKEIKQLLTEWAEPEYQAFASRLLPGCGNVLGVRLPKLRKLAKKLADTKSEAKKHPPARVIIKLLQEGAYMF
nr:hypothetical protein [Marasmitruncus massiliensis]